MTPQEQQLIDGLVNRIRSTPATDKDQEADKYLHQNLDGVPDALYVLAQTVLVQQYGLQNAQQQLQAAQEQIDDLQQQLDQARAQQPQRSGSFLGHLFGKDDAPQQPSQSQQPGYQPVNTGYPPPPPGYGAPAYGAPGYGGPAYGQPTYAQPAGFGGGGGFLRGALQTAAGVAAGEMVFQGMEDLFHGFGREGGYGEGRPTEVINNNYYDDRPDSSHEHRAEGSDDSSFYDPSNDASRQGLSPDIEDRRGFASTDDQADNDTGNDQGFDDSSDFSDSGSLDDGGGFDDSSSNDDGSF